WNGNGTIAASYDVGWFVISPQSSALSYDVVVTPPTGITNELGYALIFYYGAPVGFVAGFDKESQPFFLAGELNPETNGAPLMTKFFPEDTVAYIAVYGLLKDPPGIESTFVETRYFDTTKPYTLAVLASPSPPVLDSVCTYSVNSPSAGDVT